MQHAPFVRRGQARAQLARDFDRFILRKPSDAAQQRRQVLAVDVLHGQEVPPVDLAGVVDPAHVRVRHLPGQPDLAQEALEPARVARQIVGQEFERHLLPELQVVGPVDLAHAAPPEQTDDAVAAGEDDAGGEAGRVAGIGRSARAGGARPGPEGVRGRRGRQNVFRPARGTEATPRGGFAGADTARVQGRSLAETRAS